MSSTLIIVIAAVVAAILIAVLLMSIYVKASPQVAYIISGIKKNPRVLIGTGGFKIPFLERMDQLFLGQITVDVKTSVPVPTHDFIDVMVDAVCKVRAIQSPEGIQLAAKNFLNLKPAFIASEIKDSLEGNMREVVGAITLQNLVTDRDKFSDEIQQKAAKDMAKLGLEILSCNIQNITDQNGLIAGLGADNTAAIQKNASITKANAEKEIAIAQAKADKEANDAKVAAQTEIAERNNELAIKQADLKKQSDTKKAEADAAYAIQQQEQQKMINVKTVEAQAAEQILFNEKKKEINRLEVAAEVEKAKQEQLLKEQEIAIRQKALEAEVNKKADADKYQAQVAADARKYQTEINAQAMLEQQKREAEASAYLAQKEAEAQKAKAEAKRFEMEQEALGIKSIGVAEAEKVKAVGLAEAQAIKAKGLAEAEAMERKADAYSKYGQAAIVEILSGIMPQMAEAVAKPISAIDAVNIYGGDGAASASKLSANVPTVIKQTLDTLKSVTGVDIAEFAQKKLTADDNKQFEEVN